MLSSTANKVQYAKGAGWVTDYPVTFKYWAKSEIVAVLSYDDGTADWTLVLDTDYSLTAAGETGTLSRITDWGAAVRLTIYRALEFVQETDYRDGEALPADTIETDLDRVAARDQQIEEEIDRTVTVPITDEEASLELPSAGERANAYLAFDADGNAIPAADPGSYPASPFMGTVLDDVTALAARTTLGVHSVNVVASAGYTITDIDGYAEILVSPGTADRTVTLPTLADNQNRVITVKKSAAGGSGTTVRKVTVDGEGSETIDGQTTIDLRGAGEFVTVLAAASEWEIVAMGAFVGSILQRAENVTTPPPGYLYCNGSAISRTTYAGLYEIIGITHGQGDGSTTFNIPDYRGRFLRARDNGAGRDPDAATRTAMATGGQTGDNVGSVQNDDYKSHRHGIQGSTGGSSSWNGLMRDTARTTGGMAPADNSGNNYNVCQDAPTSGGNETRATNANVHFFVKY